jgi:hypothetical protein
MDVVVDQPNVLITVGRMVDAAPSSPGVGGHQQLEQRGGRCGSWDAAMRAPRAQFAGSGAVGVVGLSSVMYAFAIPPAAGL